MTEWAQTPAANATSGRRPPPRYRLQEIDGPSGPAPLRRPDPDRDPATPRREPEKRPRRPPPPPEPEPEPDDPKGHEVDIRARASRFRPR